MKLKRSKSYWNKKPAYQILFLVFVFAFCNLIYVACQPKQKIAVLTFSQQILPSILAGGQKVGQLAMFIDGSPATNTQFTLPNTHEQNSLFTVRGNEIFLNTQTNLQKYAGQTISFTVRANYKKGYDNIVDSANFSIQVIPVDIILENAQSTIFQNQIANSVIGNIRLEENSALNLNPKDIKFSIEKGSEYFKIDNNNTLQLVKQIEAHQGELELVLKIDNSVYRLNDAVNKDKRTFRFDYAPIEIEFIPKPITIKNFNGENFVIVIGELKIKDNEQKNITNININNSNTVLYNCANAKRIETIIEKSNEKWVVKGMLKKDMPVNDEVCFVVEVKNTQPKIDFKQTFRLPLYKIIFETKIQNSPITCGTSNKYITTVIPSIGKKDEVLGTLHAFYQNEAIKEHQFSITNPDNQKLFYIKQSEDKFEIIRKEDNQLEGDIPLHLSLNHKNENIPYEITLSTVMLTINPKTILYNELGQEKTSQILSLLLQKNKASVTATGRKLNIKYEGTNIQNDKKYFDMVAVANNTEFIPIQKLESKTTEHFFTVDLTDPTTDPLPVCISFKQPIAITPTIVTVDCRYKTSILTNNNNQPYIYDLLEPGTDILEVILKEGEKELEPNNTAYKITLVPSDQFTAEKTVLKNKNWSILTQNELQPLINITKTTSGKQLPDYSIKHQCPAIALRKIETTLNLHPNNSDKITLYNTEMVENLAKITLKDNNTPLEAELKSIRPTTTVLPTRELLNLFQNNYTSFSSKSSNNTSVLEKLFNDDEPNQIKDFKINVDFTLEAKQEPKNRYVVNKDLSIQVKRIMLRLTETPCNQENRLCEYKNATNKKLGVFKLFHDNIDITNNFQNIKVRCNNTTAFLSVLNIVNGNEVQTINTITENFSSNTFQCTFRATFQDKSKPEILHVLDQSLILDIEKK